MRRDAGEEEGCEFSSKIPRIMSNLPDFPRRPFLYAHLCVYTKSMAWAFGKFNNSASINQLNSRRFYKLKCNLMARWVLYKRDNFKNEKKGVWLFYPLADCPLDGWSSMDDPPYGLSRTRIAHRNDSSPAWKLHP
jgi:hypothetical protein